MQNYKPEYFKKGASWVKPTKPFNAKYKDVFPCWKCGTEIEVIGDEPKDRVFCEKCLDLHKTDHGKLIKEYTLMKAKVMFENAIRMMEKSKKVYLHEYMIAGKSVYNMAVSETDKFMSSHEMVVAIMLEELGFEYRANYPILNYKADFYIPELRTCVEVDGISHKYKAEFDSRRDIDIRGALGSEWEIVRIPTKYIEENPTKIIEAIEALAKEKRRLRKKNFGAMPYGFSERENKHYDNIAKM